MNGGKNESSNDVSTREYKEIIKKRLIAFKKLQYNSDSWQREGRIEEIKRKAIEGPGEI